MGHAVNMTTLNSPDAAPLDPTPDPDKTRDAILHAAGLLKEEDIAEARKVIEDALRTTQPSPELLWTMADIDFADGDLQAGMTRLSEAAKLAGQEDAATVSRRIEALSLNRLWQEALAAVEHTQEPLRNDPRVREAAGGFYRARGCHGHAIDSYGSRAGLSPEARSARRKSSVLSGGPFEAVHRRVSSWEESKLLTRLREGMHSSAQLDTVPGMTAGEVFRMKAMIDSAMYEWWQRYEVSLAISRWLMRLLPVAVLPVWLVLFVVAKMAAFISGSGGTAGGSFVGAIVALGPWALGGAVLLTRLFVRSDLTPRLGIVLSLRGLYVLCAVTVGLELGAAIAYDRRLLPSSGWSAWIVLGLVSLPAVFMSMMICGMIITFVEWRGVIRVIRNNCQFILSNLLLLILTDLQSPGHCRDLAQRQKWAEDLEWVAKRVRDDLLPSTFLDQVGTGEWLRRRVAGWVEAFHQMQREMVTPVPGGQHKLESVIRHQIQCFATGNLGALAWRQPSPKAPRRSSFWRTVTAILRTILVAALPLLAVLAAQSVLHFSEGEFRWATVITGAWALLYVIICLDPTVRDKIETARSLTGVLNQAQGMDPFDRRKLLRAS